MRKRLAAVLVVALAVLAAQSHADARPRPGRTHHRVCSKAKSGKIACYAQVIEQDGSATPFVTNSIAYGSTPSQIKHFYAWPTANTAGTGKTIAIISAYNAPTLATDLGVFSQKFGLPGCAVSTGCLRIVNQTGGTTLPVQDAGWAFEASLDTQWAHAIAPGAKILVVEAAGANLRDLFAAVDYAKTKAQYVSMSWGALEFTGESTLDTHFVQSGVSFFAAAGDDGLPANYPSSSPNVISVGGTSISWTKYAETGWSGGGGGCSTSEPAPAPQSRFASYASVRCGGKRATPDVSADADPASGVPVYDSTVFQNASGWFVAGGTSLSTPMTAARSAVRGTVVNSATIYSTTLWFHDVNSGNNGAPCLTGYDLCSGRGSWVA